MPDSGANKADCKLRSISSTPNTTCFELTTPEVVCDAIEEREKRLEELRKLHIQNETILQSAGEGILGLDEKGNVVFVNLAASEMLGRVPEEIGNRHFSVMVHGGVLEGEDGISKKCPLESALKEGVKTTGADLHFVRKNGDPFPVEYVAQPTVEEERVTGLVLTFRDISGRRLMEAQLRQSQKLESIGQLAAGIAHEINTPTQYIGDNTRFLEEVYSDVNAILSLCAQFLDIDDTPTILKAVESIRKSFRECDAKFLMAEIPKALSQMQDGVQRVAKIVRSMKEFSHPGGEKRQAIDLNHAIESTVTVSRNEWKYVADIRMELAEDLPLITCLPSDINQVILNLIVNAAHAIGDKLKKSGQGAEKGVVTIRTKAEKDFVEIQVSDTGVGIPKEISNRIYDPFFTTKEVGRGTGQGLAIVHSIIVEKHKGAIRFESVVDKGTTLLYACRIRFNNAPGRRTWIEYYSSMMK